MLGYGNSAISSSKGVTTGFKKSFESMSVFSGLATRTKTSISIKLAILATFSLPMTKVYDLRLARLRSRRK